MIANSPPLAGTCAACALFKEQSCFVQMSSQTRALEKMRRVQPLREGQVLISEGQKSRLVGLVIEGVLRVSQTTRDGRQQILGLQLPSSFFGHPFAPTPAYGLEAASDSRVCLFDRKDFERLIAEDFQLSEGLLLATMNELQDLRELASTLGLSRTSERIARFLCLLHSGETIGSYPAITVPVGRRDLASLLGTTPETISRFVQDMVRKSILRVRRTNAFIVLDSLRFEELAGRSLQQSVDSKLWIRSEIKSSIARRLSLATLNNPFNSSLSSRPVVTRA